MHDCVVAGGGDGEPTGGQDAARGVSVDADEGVSGRKRGRCDEGAQCARDGGD